MAGMSLASWLQGTLPNAGHVCCHQSTECGGTHKFTFSSFFLFKPRVILVPRPRKYYKELKTLLSLFPTSRPGFTPTWFRAAAREEPSKPSPDYTPEAPSAQVGFAPVGRPDKGLLQTALGFWGAHRQQEKPSAWKLL